MTRLQIKPWEAIRIHGQERQTIELVKVYKRANGEVRVHFSNVA
jgi:hypothetical protein